MIAGLSADALIAPWVIKGTIVGLAFAADVRQVVIPEIAHGTAVVPDNLSTHRNQEATAALKANDC